MADLPDILKGPGMDVVSGLALGAFMGNPLLGLALAPEVNRRRRGAEADMEATKANTAAQEAETLAANNRAADIEAARGLLASGANIQDLPPELKLGLTSSSAVAPDMFYRGKNQRPTAEEQREGVLAFMDANGIPRTEENMLRVAGLMAPAQVLTPQEQRIRDMEEEAARLALTAKQEALEADARALKRENEIARDAVSTMSSVVFEVEDALTDLESDVFLRPGIPFSEEIGQALSVWDRVESFAKGADEGGRRKAIDAQQKLIKNSQRFVAEYLNFREANGLGSASVAFQRLAERFTPDTNLSVPTIRGITAATAADMLKADSRLAEGFNIPPQDRARLQGIVDGYRGSKKVYENPDEVRAMIETGVLRPGDVITFNGPDGPELITMEPEDFQ